MKHGPLEKQNRYLLMLHIFI